MSSVENYLDCKGVITLRNAWSSVRLSVFFPVGMFPSFLRISMFAQAVLEKIEILYDNGDGPGYEDDMRYGFWFNQVPFRNFDNQPDF